MTKAVHRIWPSAQKALEEIVKREGGKPSDVISQLLIDYLAGLDFSKKCGVRLH